MTQWVCALVGDSSATPNSRLAKAKAGEDGRTLTLTTHCSMKDTQTVMKMRVPCRSYTSQRAEEKIYQIRRTKDARAGEKSSETVHKPGASPPPPQKKTNHKVNYAHVSAPVDGRCPHGNQHELRH
jgi:hypothetical protein